MTFLITGKRFMTLVSSLVYFRRSLGRAVCCLSVSLLMFYVVFQEIFENSSVLPICEQCLQSMQGLLDKLRGQEQEDRVLEQRYQEHGETWKRLQSDVQAQAAELQAMPERWKTYNERSVQAYGNIDTKVHNSVVVI